MICVICTYLCYMHRPVWQILCNPAFVLQYKWNYYYKFVKTENFKHNYLIIYYKRKFLMCAKQRITYANKFSVNFDTSLRNITVQIYVKAESNKAASKVAPPGEWVQWATCSSTPLPSAHRPKGIRTKQDLDPFSRFCRAQSSDRLTHHGTATPVAIVRISCIRCGRKKRKKSDTDPTMFRRRLQTPLEVCLRVAVRSIGGGSSCVICSQPAEWMPAALYGASSKCSR